MVKTSGIYKVVNLANGMTYVGQTVNLETRWSSIKSDAKRHHHSPVLDAMNEFGFEVFSFSVIMPCPREELEKWETHFINELGARHPAGYNMSGFRGGQITKEIFDAMAPDVQEAIKQKLIEKGRLGIKALRELRKNPDFEKIFLQAHSIGAFTREANIKRKRAENSDYDQKERLRRANAASMGYERSKDDPEYQLARKQSSDTFHERMKDPEYASRIRANRRRAALASVESRRMKN